MSDALLIDTHPSQTGEMKNCRATVGNVGRIANLTDIVNICAAFFGVPASTIIGKRRHMGYVEARHMAMYLARKHTGLSLEYIGTHMGGRDHTTVMHGVRMIVERMELDDLVRSRVNYLNTEIKQFAAGLLRKGAEAAA